MCVDLDREVDSDLKPSTAPPATQGISRMNAIRQGLLLLVYAKLQMDSRHRFRLATIGEKFSWVSCPTCYLRMVSVPHLNCLEYSMQQDLEQVTGCLSYTSNVHVSAIMRPHLQTLTYQQQPVEIRPGSLHCERARSTLSEN